MHLAYKTILVAVDGSNEAKRALQKAIGLATLDQAKLVIAHVIDNRTTGTLDYYDRNYAKRTEDEGRKLLDHYKSIAHEAGVEVIMTELSFGSPKIVIPKEIAVKYKADVIIAGATGINAVERFIIGSVSEGIVRRATCDVLIVRS